MHIVEVEDIPISINPRRKSKRNLKDFIQVFINSDIKYAELIFTNDEYKTPYNAYTTFYHAIRGNNYPVWVYLRNGRVYLENMNV